MLCVIFGFGLTINTLNMDQFIVRQNTSRVMVDSDEAAETYLDTAYLTSLSSDAVPVLVHLFTDDETPALIRDDIGGVLACRLAVLDEMEGQSWVSYHHSRQQEVTLLQAFSPALEKYPTFFDEYTWFVDVNDEVKPCWGGEIPVYD